MMKTRPSGQPMPARKTPPPARSKPANPHYHPATGQILSPTEETPDAGTKGAHRPKKARAAITIAPSTPTGPDVSIHSRKGGPG